MKGQCKEVPLKVEWVIEKRKATHADLVAVLEEVAKWSQVMLEMPPGTAPWCGAEENCLEAFETLHEVRTELGMPSKPVNWHERD